MFVIIMVEKIWFIYFAVLLLNVFPSLAVHMNKMCLCHIRTLPFFMHFFLPPTFEIVHCVPWVYGAIYWNTGNLLWVINLKKTDSSSSMDPRGLIAIQLEVGDPGSLPLCAVVCWLAWSYVASAGSHSCREFKTENVNYFAANFSHLSFTVFPSPLMWRSFSLRKYGMQFRSSVWTL